MPEHPGGVPDGWKPLMRDDSLPHQIRIVGANNHLSVSCVCRTVGVNESFTKTALEPLAPIKDAAEAQAIYKTHLQEATA